MATSSDTTVLPNESNSHPGVMPNGAEQTTKAQDIRELNFSPAGLITLEEGGLRVIASTQPQDKNTRGNGPVTFPYYHILWSSCTERELTVSYAVHDGDKVFTTKEDRYIVKENHTPAEIQSFSEALLSSAYGRAKRQKRIKILVNPFGGKGKARDIYDKLVEPIFREARCHINMIETQHRGHGAEIASHLNIEEWDVVACASGDGLPHEVFNGLAEQEEPRRALRQIAVAMLPCGSGNAMSYNLFNTGSPTEAALAIVKGIRMPLDLVSVMQYDEQQKINKRTLSFLSQSFGIIAEADLATEKWRSWGSFRFDVGFLTRWASRRVWPADIAIRVTTDGASVKGTKPVDGRKDILDHWNTYRDTGTDVDPDVLPPGTDTGLPPLRFGMVRDPLTPDWIRVPSGKLINFWAGNMARMSPEADVFRAALPCDGLLDLIHVNNETSGMWRQLQLSSSAGKDSGNLLNVPEANYQKVIGYRVVPRKDEGYISIDGERFPFSAFQAEVHKGLGTVLVRSDGDGRMFYSRGITNTKV